MRGKGTDSVIPSRWARGRHTAAGVCRIMAGKATVYSTPLASGSPHGQHVFVAAVPHGRVKRLGRPGACRAEREGVCPPFASGATRGCAWFACCRK